MRPVFVSALNKLSQRSGLCPACLIIRGVQKTSSYPITGGSSGEIWKGKIGSHNVAIKILRQYVVSNRDAFLKVYASLVLVPRYLDVDGLQKFSREIVTWRQLFHPNVLPFYGVYTEDDSPVAGLISPWMGYGNVREFLSRTPRANKASLVSSTTAYKFSLFQ